MRRLEWYEVVQATRRHPDGAIAEWYPGDNKTPVLAQAKAERAKLVKEFPGTEFTVIRTTIEEIGQARKG